MGLSLWLVPTDERQRMILSRAMDFVRSNLRDRSGGSFDISGPFPPHLTLLTGINDNVSPDDVWAIFEEAEREWQGMKPNGTREVVCPLESVTSRGLYFQCIVAAIALSRSQGLALLNSLLRQKYKLEDQAPYWPHISLVYAHLDRNVALEHIQHLAENGLFQFQDDGVLLGVNEVDRLGSVTFGAVELWRTGDDVSQWKLLKRRSLRAEE